MTDMNNQVNMAILGVSVLSDDHLKLIKKVSVLTGKPEQEFAALSVMELKSVISEDNKKKQEIKNLKKKYLKENFQYNEALSIKDNEGNYSDFIDKKNNPSFIYPFRLYFKGCDIQEPDHIFEFDKSYTTKEITTMLFKAGYKEFAGKVNLTYDEDDNMLVPEFTSQRHG